MKTKIYKEINKLVILGIIKKEVIRSLQPRNGYQKFTAYKWPYTEKNSDISKVVADYSHLQTRLPHLNIIFTLYNIILRNYLMQLRIILLQHWIYLEN